MEIFKLENKVNQNSFGINFDANKGLGLPLLREQN